MSKTSVKTKTEFPIVPKGQTNGFADVDEDFVDEYGKDALPWIGFQANSGTFAPKVAGAIPGIEAGDPFVYLGDDKFVDARDARIAVLPTLIHECVCLYTKGSDKKLVGVREDFPSKEEISEAKANKTYYTEAVSFVGLILLPDGSAVDSVVALSRFEGAKRWFVRGMREAVAKAAKPTWGNLSDLNAAHVQNGTPAGYRVVGKLDTRLTQPKGDGDPYTKCNAKVFTTTASELTRLYGIDQEQIDAAAESFKARVDYLNSRMA